MGYYLPREQRQKKKKMSHSTRAVKRRRRRSRSHSRTPEKPKRVDRKRSTTRTNSQDTSVQQLTEALMSLVAHTSTKTVKTTIRGEVVPTFDPENREQNADKWCHHVDELREIFHWSEEATIYYALSKLCGLAEIWYKSLPTLKFSWSEWKLKIKAAFPSKRDYYETLSDMMRRKKQGNEGYPKYFYEKLALLNACKIYGQDAVSCIIGGIDDEIVKPGAKAGNHQTPESLFQYVSTLPNVPTPISFKHRQEGYRRERHTMIAKNTHKDRSIVCFNCKKTGHKANECPVRDVTKRCNFCRRSGHAEDKCYIKKKKAESVQVVA